MKRLKVILSVCLALVLLSSTLLTLSACGNDENKDNFGFERDENTWLFDCILFSEDPGDFDGLVGETGDSGLLSTVAKERDGRSLKNGKGWLICLWYGDGIEYTSYSTYLRFSLVNSDGVYYDDECVKIVKETNMDPSKTSFKGFEQTPDKRLQIPGSDTPRVQGGIILEFEVLDGLQGNVYVECYANYSYQSELEKVYVDNGAEAKTANVDVEANVKLSDLSIKYLSVDGYNEGDFVDDRLVDEPPFYDGTVVYMVVDFSMKATKDNAGAHTMGVMLSISNRFIVYSTVEDAPTSKLMQINKGDEMHQYAEYSVPASKGETKDVRMIYQLVGAGNGGISIDVYFVGAPAVELDGVMHVEALQNSHVAGGTLKLKLSADKTYYIVDGVASNLITEVTITDTMDDGTPIKTIGAGAFSNLTQITSVTIGQNVTEIAAGAFTGCISLETVALGIGIRNIGADAFAYTNVTEIDYTGTVEEWKAIQKTEGWNKNSRIARVICSDGTVSVS